MKRKSADPYVYPGTKVLKNREHIREASELEQFERLMSAQRLREGLPDIPLTPNGYCSLHHHLFQDVYDWAGSIRSVAIAKQNSMFCLPGYILPELEKRFGLIRLDESLRSRDAVEFATPAAEHLSELNAIHPFREGNGRTQRAFLIVLAKQAGLEISIRQIDPEAWNHASRESFRTGDAATLREVILGAIGFKKCPPKPTAAS